MAREPHPPRILACSLYIIDEGMSFPGFSVKKLSGFSMNPIMAAGSSGRISPVRAGPLETCAT